jgi:K+-sensing histidine kinase KdpD
MLPAFYPSPAVRYTVVLAASGLALALALPLHAAFQLSSFPLFLCAVMLSAYYGGTRAGLLATLLGALAINYFFESPRYSLEITAMDTVVKLLVFLATALLISTLTERMRSAELQAEEARAAAEATQQRLEHMLGRVEDALFAVDSEWRITYASPRTALTILTHRGPMTSDRLIGTTLWDIWTGDKSALVAARFREAMATQSAVEFEDYHPLTDRWVAFRAFPSTDGLSVYCHDITAAKRSGERLRSMIFVAEEVGSTLNRVLTVAAQECTQLASEAELPAAARVRVDRISQHLDTATERAARLERVVRMGTQSSAAVSERQWQDADDK